ncbi:MAG TPA: hypothetical protein VGD95_00815, partial [Micavibrio sp.]
MPVPAFSKAARTGLIAVMAALLLPWVLMNILMVGNADNLWLAEGYRRWAGGADLATSFFEVNPPLSLWLYAVPAELSSRLGWALHHAIFFYTLAVVAAASLVLWQLLRQVDFLSTGERALVIGGFVIATTVLTTGFFGERDHFVAIALVLLLCAQFIITMRYQVPQRRLAAVVFVSGFILLLKPHYLILPALMLCHRALKRRSLRAVLRDVDGWAILAACVSYVGILHLFFQDYLTQILPAVLEYYGLHKAYDTIMLMGAQVLAGAVLFSGLAYALVQERTVRRFIWGLMVMAALALLPFLAQGMGYAYHLLPSTTLLWMGLAVILYHLVLKQNPHKPVFASLLALVLCTVGAYAAKMPQRSFISHAQYAQLPLVQ